jgi:serine/threonine protein kinase
MDKTRAKRFAKELEGQSCCGWVLQDYINCGKSAIVLRARKGEQVAAIKIFDPELVERHGAEVQLQRIEREKSLIGKSHPNLIQILDGGFWEERGLYFVVMEFLPWKNLAEVLTIVPLGREREIIAQVASAAHFLEGLGICHRDIKPENVAISPDFQKAKLLDLGVIKPQGTKPITDGTHAKVFVGTLKYSPPEFLLRKEADTPDGWRAITFYQLGGVLHDLIMRRSLFADFENPFAALVNAVQFTTPVIESKSVSPALVELVRECLLKKAELRLQLVSWDLFEKEPPVRDTVADIKSRISRRLVAKRDGIPAPRVGQATLQAAAERLNTYASSILSICRIECVENRDLFPPIEIQAQADDTGACCVVMQFEPSPSHDLSLFLRIEICLRWVDSEGDVVDVSVAAFASKKQFDPNTPIAKTGTRIYRGTYVAESVRPNILVAVYRALDEAHEVKTTGKPDAQVHQLNLEEERI